MVHTLEGPLIWKLIQTMKGNSLMNKILFSLVLISCLILNGCEDNETNNNITGEEVITHDIDALGAAGFYFNLSSGTEVDSSSTWHLSFQMIPVESEEMTYMMPNFILGATAYMAEYNNVTFENLDSTPDSFMSDYFQDTSVLQYEGPNEIIQYNGQTHIASIRDPERVFVVYELGNHKTYKIQFNEYVRGVVVFKYESL